MPSVRMKPVAAATLRTTPEPSEDLEHLSIYALWCRHCMSQSLDVDELAWAGLKQRKVFGLSSLSSQDIEQLSTELKVSRAVLAQAAGSDLLRGEGRTSLLRPELRFCASCLRFGYHSVLFQHPAITRCPLHYQALTTNCPACGATNIPTYASVTEHPFECAHCLHSFTSALSGTHDQQHAEWVDGMLGSRRKALSARSAAGGSLVHEAKLAAVIPLSVATSRHYERATVWSVPGDPQWVQFREQARSVRHAAGEASDCEGRLHLKRAVERSLIWLRANCQLHEKCAMRLAYRLGTRPDGLRLNAHASVVGTALFKLAVNYRLVRELLELCNLEATQLRGYGVLDSRSSPLRYGPSTPELPLLDAELLQLEMLGAFAKLLVREKSGSALLGVNWLDFPHPLEFAPAVRCTAANDLVNVRLRVRATEELVLKLLKRRWFDEHAYVADDPAASSSPDAGCSVWWEGLSLGLPCPQGFRIVLPALVGVVPPPGEPDPQGREVSVGWVAMEAQRMWEALTSRQWPAPERT